MPRLKRWLDQARKLAEERLPDEVLDAGRRLRDTVLERAPTPIADAVARYVPRDQEKAHFEPSEAAPAPAASETAAHDPPPAPPRAPDREEVLRRVHDKADHGLKPEDRLVVIYATADETEAVAAIRADLARVETTVREMDLAKQPQTARQIAQLTGVMVPPYVFINGRYWGGQYEVASLTSSGDLENVIANRLDAIGEEARRIGKIHESFSDEVSIDNILDRWRRGHILCVDDLDSWYEVDREGNEHFYYQGGPRPVAEMPTVAEEIVRGVEGGELEVAWMLDPAVQLN